MKSESRRCTGVESRLDRRLAAHQRAAVLEILARLRTNFGVILADEAGLGKSWIAISVAREFIWRGGEAEIIVPASLIGTWQREMDFLGLAVPISSHERLQRRLARAVGPAEKLVIVDEAHRFRNPARMRFAALCRLSLEAKLILVTATPFCNSLADLETLVSLVAADDSFRADGVWSSHESFLTGRPQWMRPIREKTIICRRAREAGIQLPRISERRIEFSLGDSWDVVRDAIADLELPMLPRPHDATMAKEFLELRYLSSPDALGDSIGRLGSFCREARKLARVGWSLERSQYRRIFGDGDEDHPIQELLFPGVWLDEISVSDEFDAQLQRDVRRLDDLRTMLQSVSSAKLACLHEVLLESRDAVIVFCSSIATAQRLFVEALELRPSGLITSRRARVEAGRRIGREQVIEAFTQGSIDVLVMTDLGAEGLNLQVAGRIVHYDLPWNPARVAQRVARSRRIGQRRASVESILFVPKDLTARRVYSILRRKEKVWNRWQELAADVMSLEARALPFEHSRACIPSRIPARAPQVLIAKWLDKRRLLDTQMGFLLSRRYRAGVERFLEELSSRDLSKIEIQAVRRVLVRELEASETDLSI